MYTHRQDIYSLMSSKGREAKKDTKKKKKQEGTQARQQEKVGNGQTVLPSFLPSFLLSPSFLPYGTVLPSFLALSFLPSFLPSFLLSLLPS